MLKTKTIKGFSNYTVSPIGEIYNKKTSKEITQTLDPRGYHYVTILNDSGKWEKLRVHVAVGNTFIGKRKKNFIYDHKDGNKDDCSVDNLELISMSDNTKRWHSANRNGGYKYTGKKYQYNKKGI